MPNHFHRNVELGGCPGLLSRESYWKGLYKRVRNSWKCGCCGLRFTPDVEGNPQPALDASPKRRQMVIKQHRAFLSNVPIQWLDVT